MLTAVRPTIRELGRRRGEPVVVRVSRGHREEVLTTCAERDHPPVRT